MLAYLIRRLLLIAPTLFGIMLVAFVIVQFAPGGPVERMIAQISGQAGGDRLSGGGGDLGAQSGLSADAGQGYRGSQGLDPAFIAMLNKQYGFDKPAPERFWLMVSHYLRFDFGQSYFRSVPVLQLIKERLPVSISLGVVVTLLSYLISIPLGIRKAVHDGTAFDAWTSTLVTIGYAIPGFLFGVLLIVLLAGSSFLQIFPQQGLWSSAYDEVPFWQWITSPRALLDYGWHLVLPLVALGISAFAVHTLLTKNSFLDEIRKQYVLTARMKGLTQRQVLYGHVFRNAMLIIIAGFPAAFITSFFTGSLLIETVFNLQGLGRLGYDATMDRDYPVVFATLYIFSLIGLVVNLVSDLTYMWVDPRIDFEAREV